MLQFVPQSNFFICVAIEQNKIFISDKLCFHVLCGGLGWIYFKLLIDWRIRTLNARH